MTYKPREQEEIKNVTQLLGSRVYDEDSVRRRFIDLTTSYMNIAEMSQKNFADHMKTSRQNVWFMLSTKCKYMRHPQIIRVAYALNFDLNYIYFGENSESVAMFKKEITKAKIKSLEVALEKARAELSV